MRRVHPVTHPCPCVSALKALCMGVRAFHKAEGTFPHRGEGGPAWEPATRLAPRLFSAPPIFTGFHLMKGFYKGSN